MILDLTSAIIREAADYHVVFFVEIRPVKG